MESFPSGVSSFIDKLLQPSHTRWQISTLESDLQLPSIDIAFGIKKKSKQFLEPPRFTAIIRRHHIIAIELSKIIIVKDALELIYLILFCSPMKISKIRLIPCIFSVIRNSLHISIFIWKKYDLQNNLNKIFINRYISQCQSKMKKENLKKQTW